MNFKRAKKFPLSQNLSALVHRLSDSKIPHRFIEENGEQVLCIPEHIDDIELERIIEEALHKDNKTKKTQRVSSFPSFLEQIKYTPLTFAFIVLAIIGSLISIYAQESKLMYLLVFLPLDISIEHHQIWRPITPVFLHFSILHILFNALWTWELGKRLELFLGKSLYLLCFLIIGIGANYIQFWTSDNILFGGLSGVVYGYLGMLLILSRFNTSEILRIPPGIYIFMLVWLVLGMLKVIDLFIENSVANGAHLGGFILGLAVAALISLTTYFRKTKIKPTE